MNKLKAISRALAVKLTLLVGTMSCVYAFTVWSLLPIVIPDLQTFIFYVSGGILQLVLLPLIMVGQTILSETAEKRAEEDHNTLMSELALIKELQADHAEDLQQLNIISQQLSALTAQLSPPAPTP